MGNDMLKRESVFMQQGSFRQSASLFLGDSLGNRPNPRRQATGPLGSSSMTCVRVGSCVMSPCSMRTRPGGALTPSRLFPGHSSPHPRLRRCPSEVGVDGSALRA